MKMSDVDRDQIEALARAGDRDAQIYLGWAYGRHGIYGFDAQKAEYWLRAANGANELEPMRRLARFLYDENRSEAVRWAQALIERDDFYGHFLMGHMLYHGRCGLDVSKSGAIEHFESAAGKGHIISGIQALKARHKYPLLRSAPRRELLRLVRSLIWHRLYDQEDNLATYR